MKKRLTTFFSLILMFSSGVQAQEFESAADAVKNMGVGWNLGNTLDANNGSVQDLSSETYWGQPKAKPELMVMMKEAGFGAIRVPVTWFNHMDSNGKVDEAWMNRVHEVVDYVIDAGMYCIINVHHDTGNGDTHWLHANMEIYNAQKERYEYLWKQIAEEFKDYNEKLLFESYNEMLDKYNSWCFATFGSSSKYIAEDAADAYEAINSFAQSFVDVVRASGGNNAQRNLVVNTYGACNGAGTWNEHLKDPLTEMKMPEGESNHIAFEVHNYPSISNLANAKKELDQNIKDLQETLGALGAPVIYGEWGTSSANGDGTSDYDNNRKNMIDFLQYYVKQTKAAGIGTFYWMGLTDGANRDYPCFNQPDLAETLTKAWHGDDFQGKYPTKQDVIGNSTIVYNVTYNGNWQELNLCGNVISTNDYKSIRLEMFELPAEGALKFKVYGSDDNHNQMGVVSATEKNSTLVFDESILGGKTIQRITLQTQVGSQAGTCRVIRAVLVKADGTEVEQELSVFWGCSMSAEVITGITPLCIERPADDLIYNLQGQCVDNPHHGIFIQNGKKFVKN